MPEERVPITPTLLDYVSTRTAVEILEKHLPTTHQSRSRYASNNADSLGKNQPVMPFHLKKYSYFLPSSIPIYLLCTQLLHISAFCIGHHQATRLAFCVIYSLMMAHRRMPKQVAVITHITKKLLIYGRKEEFSTD
jgi:hypothetical protein